MGQYTRVHNFKDYVVAISHKNDAKYTSSQPIPAFLQFNGRDISQSDTP